MVKSPEVRKSNAKLKKADALPKANSGNKKASNNKKGLSNVECVFPNIQTLVSEKFNEEEMLTLALTESIVTAQIAQLNITDAEDEQENKKWQGCESSEEDRQWVCKTQNNVLKTAECEDGKGVICGKECADQTNKNSQSTKCPLEAKSTCIVSNEAKIINSNQPIDVANSMGSERHCKLGGLSGVNPDICTDKYKHGESRKRNEQLQKVVENSSDSGERNKNLSLTCKKSISSDSSAEPIKSNYSRKKKPIFIENSTSSSDESFDRRAMRSRRSSNLVGKQVSTSTPISLRSSNSYTSKSKSTSKTFAESKTNKVSEGSRKAVFPGNPAAQSSNVARLPIDLSQKIMNNRRSSVTSAPSLPQNIAKTPVNSQISAPSVPYNVHSCNRPPTVAHSCTPQGVHSCSRPVIMPTPAYYPNQPYPIINQCNAQISNFNHPNPQTKYSNVPAANYFPQQYVQVINPHYTGVEPHVQGYQYAMPYAGPTMLVVNPVYGSYYPTQDTLCRNSRNCQPTRPEMSVRENVPVPSEIGTNRYQNRYIPEQKQQPVYNEPPTFALYYNGAKRIEQPEQNAKLANHDFLLRPVDNYNRHNCTKETNDMQVPITQVRDCFEYGYSAQGGNSSKKVQPEGRFISRN